VNCINDILDPNETLAIHRARLLVGRNVYLELEAPLADIIRPARRDAVIQALRPRLVKEHILQIQFITRIKLADFLKLDELAGSL